MKLNIHMKKPRLSLAGPNYLQNLHLGDDKLNVILQLTKNLCIEQCTYRTSFNHGPNTNALYMLYIFQPTMWRLCLKKSI